MKSHQKEKHTAKQGSDTSSHNLKNSKDGKPQKQFGHVNNDSTKKSEASSNSKPSVHRRFKRKPWQKYNARATTVENAEGSSDTDSDTEKYKKREIVDNSLKFEEPETDPQLLKELNNEEEKDFSELCEQMRIREKTFHPDESTQLKGKIPNSVVLPQDFEKDLDFLLTLNVSQQEPTTEPVYDDSESFSKWLKEC